MQLDGKFTAEHTDDVRRLAERNGIHLPDYEFVAPAETISSAQRRFLGIWVQDLGTGGEHRPTMLIVTEVAPDGRVTGFDLSGPPGSVSRDKTPAQTFGFIGQTEGNVLRFSGRIASHRFQLSPDGAMNHVFTAPGRDSFSRVLKPVWRLQTK